VTPALWWPPSSIYCSNPIFYLSWTSCSQFYCPSPRRYLTHSTVFRKLEQNTTLLDQINRGQHKLVVILLYFFLSCINALPKIVSYDNNAGKLFAIWIAKITVEAVIHSTRGGGESVFSPTGFTVQGRVQISPRSSKFTHHTSGPSTYMQPNSPLSSHI